MSLMDPDPTKPKLVIFGKPNPRKDEIPALTEFGRWMAHLDREWETVNAPGVATIIREAYLKERTRLEKPSTMSIREKGQGPPTHRFVLVFTDAKFQQLLDTRWPEWRDYHWHIVHNPKDTKDTTKEMAYMLTQLGIKLLPEDTGNSE